MRRFAPGASRGAAATRTTATAAIVGVGVVLPGCMTETVGTTDGLPRPAQPEPLTAPPRGLEPTEMALLVGRGTRDADGDGYPDTFSVVAALRAVESPVMIEAPGSFVFELWREGTVAEPGASPFATWTFDPEATAAARTRTLYGWGHQFELSLPAAGVDDRMNRFPGDVRGRFESSNGVTVQSSDDVRPVRLGR